MEFKVKFEMVREGSREMTDWVSLEGWDGENEILCVCNIIDLGTGERGGHLPAWAEYEKNELAKLHTAFPFPFAFLQGQGELR